jgi:hypothetical protein
MHLQTDNIYHDMTAYGNLSSHQRCDMLLEVDFKWLMAGQGCNVDPIRLRNDAVYAKVCFQFALYSDCDPLRICAADLKAEFDGEMSVKTYSA